MGLYEEICGSVVFLSRRERAGLAGEVLEKLGVLVEDFTPVFRGF